MPPRHGKSEKVSVRFPAWFLGRNPDKRVILASYGAELSEEWSLKVRQCIESPEYQTVFGKLSTYEGQIDISAEARKVAAWTLDGHMGGMVAAGVGGAITGRGAHLFIIDDPVKDREEADSEIMRRKIQDWYKSVARTRLQPGGAIVVMMTRWHEDDLIGWLLETQKEKWTVLNLPAIAGDDDQMGRVPGQALWDERYPLSELQSIREDIGHRDFQSLYQQQPASAEGEIFKKEWFCYGRMPERDDIQRCFQVWDTAFTEKSEGDPSVCGTFFVTRDGLYLADVYRAHLSFPKLKEQMKRLHTLWSKTFRVSRIYIENKGSGMSAVQSLKKDSNLPVIPVEPDSALGKSKMARAESASGYIEAGRVVFRENAHWLQDFEHELLMFPRAKHDDMVDVLVYGILMSQGGGKPPRRSLDRYKRDIASSEWTKKSRHSKLLGGW